MDRRKCSPVIGRMIAQGCLDLQERRSKLRIEFALDTRRTVEAAYHARDDARQRLGEDRNRQCGAPAFLVVGHNQLMAFVRTRARRLDFDMRINGPRKLAAEYGRQPFGRNCIGRTGHIPEPPGLWSHETFESDASSDFQRCKGSACRCTHCPALRSAPYDDCSDVLIKPRLTKTRLPATSIMTSRIRTLHYDMYHNYI